MKEDMKIFETEMLKRFTNERMRGAMLDLCGDEFSADKMCMKYLITSEKPIC